MPRRTGRIGDVSLFKPRKIKDLAVAAITGLVLLNLTRCHFMSELKKGPSTGTDGSNPAPSSGESCRNGAGCRTEASHRPASPACGKVCAINASIAGLSVRMPRSVTSDDDRDHRGDFRSRPSEARGLPILCQRGRRSGPDVRLDRPRFLEIWTR
jgi:hypothetical protein